MDDLKDLQARNISKFLDTDVRTNPFGHNRSGERAYRRAERLVAAVFLLTNHIDAEEPIRRVIRSTAISLLPRILSLRDEMRAPTSQRVIESHETIRQLISQIRILVFGGFLSSQNAEIVSGALDDLGNFIVLSQRTDLSEGTAISREELTDVREFHKGHQRDIKDRRRLKDMSPALSSALPLTQSVMSSRGSSIVEILRTGGELNIKDIASNLPEYGEKTIQRELAALIHKGLVRRSGLKRWSRYSLVNNERR